MTNLLKDKYPDIAAEWDYEKNDGIDLNEITFGSNKIVWWKCKCGVKWKASSVNRVWGRAKCPNCKIHHKKNNKIIIPRSIKNDNEKRTLVFTHPLISKEWHPIKNEDLTPDKITHGSVKLVWWMCEKGHEYQQTIGKRTNEGRGCIECKNYKKLYENSLEKYYPNITKEWHLTKNNCLPSVISYKSRNNIWWKCRFDHEWKMSIATRMMGKGCPFCKDVVEYDQVKLKNIMNELHPNKNDGNDIQKTNIKLWWKCCKGHEWQAKTYERLRGKGCPYCNGKKICENNNFEAMYPEIAKEWNLVKNGDLKPNEVFPISNLKVWWKCCNGHEWIAPISDRTYKNLGCRYCSGQLIDIRESFGILHPRLVLEWDWKQNGWLIPYNFSEFSHREIHWKCLSGHTWTAQIYNRSLGSKCPQCINVGYSQIALNWLKQEEIRLNCCIKHAENGGEQKIKLNNNKIVKVDGLCKEINTVFQFHGCFWHFHDSDECNLIRNRNPNDLHPINKKKNRDLYDDTINLDKLIQDSGYKLISIWECQFKNK